MKKTLIVAGILVAGLAVVVVIAAVTSRNGLIQEVATVTPAQPGVTSAPIENISPVPTAAAVMANQIELSVESPIDGAKVTASPVVVKGKTVPGADVAVNEVDIKADSAGNFSAKVGLDEGENVISIVANDNQGNVTEKEVTVTLISTVQ